jgi:hypothetical protein
MCCETGYMSDPCCSTTYHSLPVQCQPNNVVSNIFYSINARKAIEQQREQQRQFEQAQRAAKIAHY